MMGAVRRAAKNLFFAFAQITTARRAARRSFAGGIGTVIRVEWKENRSTRAALCCQDQESRVKSQENARIKNTSE